MTLEYTDSPVQLQHMIRMCNTNIDGRKQLLKALTTIKGIGFRFAQTLLVKTKIPNCRAGELTNEQLQTLADAIADPSSVGIPVWMLNYRKEFTTGENKHLVGNQIDAADRFALERGKKIKAIRECRRARGMKVRGQRTGSNGRHGRIVGVSRKK